MVNDFRDTTTWLIYNEPLGNVEKKENMGIRGLKEAKIIRFRHTDLMGKHVEVEC